jgi:hypothetical protein
MGFIRQQEEKLAMRFLSWQYEKLKQPVPAEAELEQQAAAMSCRLSRISLLKSKNSIPIGV